MRPTSALATVAVVGMLAASLTSCSSSGKTNGAVTPGGTTSTTAPQAPTTAPELAAKLLAASRSVTSAHVDLDFTFAGTTLHGSGDETLSNGNLDELDLSESMTSGAGSFRIIRAGGKTYLKLPSEANPGGKPYILVSPHSSNPVVQQLASSLDTLQSASIKSYETFVQAATSIKMDGSDTVNGVSATHYSVTVDARKLPATSGITKQALSATGVKTIPVELWIDDQGRPVKVTEKLSAGGKSVSVAALIGRYNQPVTITAPPASQVSTN